MVELCLTASSTILSSTGLFHQEQSRPSKELRTVIPCLGRKQELTRSGVLYPRSPLVGDRWKPMGWVMENNQCAKLDTTIKKPVLIDIQDTLQDSTLFSFGIAENCTRRQKILEYLMSRSSEAEKDVLDFSLLSELMGIQTSALDMRLQSLVPRDDGLCLYEVGDNEPRPSLVYPGEYFCERHVVDPVGDLTNSSRVVVDSDGKVLFTGTLKGNKQSFLVPHFTRFDTCESQLNVQGSSFKLEAMTVAPLKSPHKVKLKPLKKRSSKKTEREGHLYRRNGLHACESLLSIILDKKHGKATILSVKKSGPELPQLLNQFSAGIAGTGLAVLFSVLCKVASGRVPFCVSKLLNTGFGFGLVWLAWAFNRLRDTVVYINKNSSNTRMNEKEMMRRVDKSVNEIFFRAATIMAVAVLRLA